MVKFLFRWLNKKCLSFKIIKYFFNIMVFVIWLNWLISENNDLLFIIRGFKYVLIVKNIEIGFFFIYFC